MKRNVPPPFGIMKHRLLRFMALLACVFQPAAALAGDTLNIGERLGAIAPENRFHDPGYFVWCGSGIRGEDGRYYLFYARWKTGSEGRATGDEQLFKDMMGWMKYSEIAAAVSDSPTGPFKPLGVVLRGTGDPKNWDCFTAHNAHVKRFGGKVYLYYTSTRPVPHQTDRWMQYADGQRIGVAVADSVKDLVAGRFKRCAEPLMAPDGTRTFCRAVNPGVTQGRDGRYLMMFKSRSAPTGGFMTMWVATADKPDGPFELAGPALTESRYNAEDAFLWFDRQRDRYYAIVKDFSRKERGLSPQFGSLALITSENGWGDWKPAGNSQVSLREFTDTEGRKHTLANLERPQLLLSENDEPICLYAAAGEQNPFKGTPSFNLAIPIRAGKPNATGGISKTETGALKSQATPVDSGSVRKTDAAALRHFADMKFGIMFHWGPAVLHDREISWSMSNRETYEAVYPRFNPKHFDADAWVKVAKSAGARYAIYVCKHHDGFCMWDTATTDNNIMRTPFKRDVTAELAATCKRGNLVFGTYLSIMDIHEDKWDRCYPARTDMPGYPEGLPHITDFTERQTLELMRKYDAKFLWYDGAWLEGWRQSEGPAKVAKAIKSQNPEALITRLGTNVEDYECMEARIGAYRPKPWEMVTSVAYPTYSYNTEIKYKSVDFLIQTLSRVACGNGNLLLNLVPDNEGAIPEEQVRIAEEVGGWLRTNRAAVYDTRGGPWYPGEWGGSTCKGKQVHLQLLPEAPEILKLPGCRPRVLTARLPGGETVPFKQSDTELQLTVPAALRDSRVTVVDLTMDAEVDGMVGTPDKQMPVQRKPDAVPLPAEEIMSPPINP